MGPWAASPRRRDALLALGLSAWLLVELTVTARDRPVEPAAYLLGLATTAPLALRWRAPVAVSLGVQAAFLAGATVVVQPDSLPQAIAVFVVATYTAAIRARTWQAAVSCGLASVLLLGAQGLLDEQYGAVGAVGVNVVYTGLVWSVAAAVRVHADRAARASALAREAVEQSDRLARDAVATDRARLARELHDVVAHALSIVVVRARGGVHEARADPAAGAVALRDVEEVAARALADMRRLLDLVHDGGAADLVPQPGIGDVADLVARASRAGVPAELTVAGVPRAVSPGLGLTAYRVVQESLTNVARHGRGGALVALTWRADVLRLEITGRPAAGAGAASGDRAAAGNGAASGGRGLAGMRERVELFGGTLLAGPRDDGAFVVRADLPVPS
jgi:signal transduction histidine kinase